MKSNHFTGISLLMAIALTAPMAAGARESAPAMKPTVCEVFNYADGEWILYDISYLGYDERGNITRLETPEMGDDKAYLEVYTYNADNMMTSAEIYDRKGDGEWVKSWREDFIYDTVVRDWRLGSTDTFFRSGSKSRWHIVVNRDNSGRVTHAEYLWSADDNPSEIQYEMNVEYDSTTGRASKIDEKSYVEDPDVRHRVWTNLEWENTDGQIATSVLSGARYNKFNRFLTGANRLKSADVTEDGVAAWSLSASYTGEKGYSGKITRGDEVIHIEEREYSGENGNYTHTLFSEGKWEQKLCEFDEHGNKVLQASAEGTDIENLDPISADFYENEYDDTTGALLQTITSRSEEGSMPALYSKEVFSKFVKIDDSGIEAVEADTDAQISIDGLTISTSPGSRLSVYTIDGRLAAASDGGSVTAPARGLYVVVVDGKAQKVVLSNCSN